MNATNYVVLVLVWAGPVILIQWLIGLDLLLRRWKVWIPSIVAVSAFMLFVDGTAITGRSRILNPTQTTGGMLPIVNMPVEQAVLVIALVTMCVQGMVLMMYNEVLLARVQRLFAVFKRNPRRPRRPTQG
ncbi:MAG: lycopene cyclase domain-containing protein [Anaerolineae bacterium]|nr:lycopene cyclase domain-containing protein [Anaerolineae bacterium]